VSFTPDKELMAELMAAYSSESAEQLQSLNSNLLALERTTDPDETERLLTEIFREAHTLKGGAAAVDLDEVGALAHHLEDIFEGLQRDEIQADKNLFDLLYQSLDVIENLIRDAQSGESAKIDISRLVENLAAAAEDDVIQPDSPEALGSVEQPSSESDAPASEHGTQPQAHRGAAKQDGAEQAAPVGLREETIRVATSKLDSLMTQVGELTVAGTGSQRSLAEIRRIEGELSELEVVWRQVRPRHRNAPSTSSRAGAGQAPLWDPASRTGLHHEETVVSFVGKGESHLVEALTRIRRLGRLVRADARRVNQATNELHDDLRRARMLPASTIFETFPRMVRDLAREQDKEVRLEIHRGDTEVDRAILEQVKAPLTHLLRNCVDHGLEEPDARHAAGKPREGTITLAASQQGDSVLIEVADDGAGIDLDKVKTTAAERGLLGTQPTAMSDREALSLIFRSGLSTSGLITDVSGRGVGLDVVRNNVEGLGGTIDLHTRWGQGTTFSLVMPLTITTTRCVLVRLNEQSFALPVNNVIRTIRINAGDVYEAEGREAILLPDGPLPLRNLASVLDLPQGRWQEGNRPALVVRSAESTVALLVDEILGVEEAVVKSLPRPLLRVRHAAGATVLGTGQIVVVLNTADIVRSAMRSEIVPITRDGEEGVAEEARPGVILLADDSITTRTLERNILQAAGYEVPVAVDGLEAWTSLQADGADLVVSDIQMPRMDGFQLTAKIRSDERFRHLPVVLVTSLESSADRERGIEVGADAYIGKSSFDQEQLLDVIRRLI
jgi:two-component system chemotaxis sensor kinase CheA